MNKAPSAGRKADGRSAEAVAGEQLLRQAADVSALPIDDGALESLLAEATVLREQDTLISGQIRVLELGTTVLVQEQTPDGQALVRSMESRDDADLLVDDRLATYDRMWDGCGCKVRYFE